MVNEDALSALLSQLDAIANAPMTAPERELRAKPLLDAGGLSPSDVGRAASRGDLPWSARKAAEYGVPVEIWLDAVHVVDLPASGSLAALLDRLHQVEAVVAILRAGYTPGRDPSGRLTWTGRG